MCVKGGSAGRTRAARGGSWSDPRKGIGGGELKFESF